MNRVLATTLCETRLVVIGARDGALLQVAFRAGGGQPDFARLHTNYGEVHLHIGQVCEAMPGSAGRQRLITTRYRYALTPAAHGEPLLRWEYVRDPPRGGLWCRHHLQGPVHLQIGRRQVSLDDLHAPTGYVTIEEVIRFCIVDLGARALSADWDETLRQSYQV